MYQSLVDALKDARVAQAIGMRGETYTVTNLYAGEFKYSLTCPQNNQEYIYLRTLWRMVCLCAGFMPTFHAVEQTRKATPEEMADRVDEIGRELFGDIDDYGCAGE